jgi:ubiquitin carboxyl-terminal hydrolase 7
LTISFSLNPLNFEYVGSRHRFIAEDCDWGFTRFSESRKLFSAQEGHGKPIVENDSVEITAYVRVVEDPTGFLWRNFAK